MLEWAHIRPRSRGGLANRSNLLAMCPTCHKLFDRLRAFWFDKSTGRVTWNVGVENSPGRNRGLSGARIRALISRGNLEYREKWAKGIL